MLKRLLLLIILSVFLLLPNAPVLAQVAPPVSCGSDFYEFHSATSASWANGTVAVGGLTIRRSAANGSLILNTRTDAVVARVIWIKPSFSQEFNTYDVTIGTQSFLSQPVSGTPAHTLSPPETVSQIEWEKGTSGAGSGPYVQMYRVWVCYNQLDQYLIEATTTVGGTISPSGNVLVDSGADQPFTITPDEGYTIADVLVDDISVGTVSSYTFNDVAANHTIHVIFNFEGFNWFKPFSTEDELSSPFIPANFAESTDHALSVLGLSNAYGDAVHAAFSGQVQVYPINQAACDAFYPTIPFQNSDPHCGYNPGSFLVANFFTQETLYLVRVVNADLGFYATYLVANAPEYVTKGDLILAGCVIGEAVKLRSETALLLDKGATFISLNAIVDHEPVELLPSLVVNPTTDTECNRDPALTDCINADPGLELAARWITAGAVGFNNPGATLASNSSISQQLNLDVTQEYGVFVRGQLAGGVASGSLRIGLGQHFQDFIINESYGFYQPMTGLFSAFLSYASYPPDIGDTFYTLLVANVGDTQIVINQVCVTGTQKGVIDNACFFIDPGFDQQTEILIDSSPWSGNGPDFVRIDPQRPGEVVVFDTGFIGQEANLYPEVESTPFTYTVTVEARILATSFYDGSQGYAELSFSYDGSTPEVIGLIDQTVIAAVGLDVDGNVDREKLYRFEGTFTVDTYTEGQFSLLVEADPMQDDLLGFRIDKVCLTAPSFPGYEPPPPFEANCQIVPRPLGNGIGEWVNFLWNSLDNFFQCDLMVLLRRLYELLTKLYQLVGWIARYIIATMVYSANWLGTDLFPWLNGHFQNIALGQITTIAGGDSGSNFWDLLISIVNRLGDILQSVIDPILGTLRDLIDTLADTLSQGVLMVLEAILNVIQLIVQTISEALLIALQGFLDLLFLIVNRIFDLIELVIGFFAMIITAWNTATPQAIPGLPNCQVNPQSQGWCIALWGLENTIFSGIGALIIPIITGVGYIHLFIWIIAKIKRTFLDVGAAA